VAKNISFNLGIVAILTLAATGCGRSNLASVAPGLSAQAFAGSTAVIQGVERKFGYDLKAAEGVVARKAHPRHLVRQGILRAAVDNRNTCSPVADQGHLGSCTAFAMGRGLREQIEVKNGGDTAPLSGLFLYYAERAASGDVTVDSGSTIDQGMSSLTDTGICHESTDPYDITKFSIKPSAAAYTEAATLKIHDSTNLASLDDVKTALNAGQTVAFGFRVYASFRNIKSDGMMPVPKAGEQLLGGHAILAVGYDDAKQVLIIRNSWSATWGDKGYFYMPYKVASNSAMVHEFWTATK
jgi:C1A family cysteine protease